MVNNPELVILFRILLAHILADFFLQRYKWIVNKRSGVRSPFLYWHIAIVGLLTYLFLADWTNWQLPVFITVTHFLIDWWKSTQRNCTRYFVADQALHISMLIIGWFWYMGYGLNDVNFLFKAINGSSFWIITCSYLLILRPTGFFIQKFTERWTAQLKDNQFKLKDLSKAGMWIGYSERSIVLTFLLFDLKSEIGFFIAAIFTAKTIFRFRGKMENHRDRMQAEYILIGTLVSFLLAILIGVGALYCLGI